MKTKIAKHSPLPWINENGLIWTKDKADLICTVNAHGTKKEVWQARAELIKNAVNNHDGLLESLKEALAMLKIYYVKNSDNSTPTITRIEQAIAKAEGKS